MGKIILCLLLVYTPCANAYWGPITQQKNTGVMWYLGEKGEAFVSYGKVTASKIYRHGKVAVIKGRTGAAYSYKEAEDGLYHVTLYASATKDRVIPVLGELADLPIVLPILSQAQWLRWLETITRSAATDFDKAMDTRYLETYIGGGNHRLFDGGHTLSGAWKNIGEYCVAAKCSAGEQVGGYFDAVIKDLSTPKGLPFVTMEQQTYDSMATWMSETIPGVDKSWVYDALSYDVLELLSAGVAAAAVVYYLDKEQEDKLSELIGSMGIVSITSANPILGLVMVASLAYALATGVDIGEKDVAEGAVKSAVISGVFVLLPTAFLVELAVVVAVGILLNRGMTDKNYAIVYNYGEQKATSLMSWLPKI